MATGHYMRSESKFDYKSDSDSEVESRPCVTQRWNHPHCQAPAVSNNVGRPHMIAAVDRSDGMPMARRVTTGAKPRVRSQTSCRMLRVRTEALAVAPAQLVVKDVVSAPKPVPALHYNSDSDSEEEPDEPAVKRLVRRWTLPSLRTRTKDALSTPSTTPLTSEVTDTDSTTACTPRDDLTERPSRDDENYVDEVVQNMAEEQHDDSTTRINEVRDCPRLCAAPADVTESEGSGGLDHADDVERRISEPVAAASELERSGQQSHENRKELGKRRRLKEKLLAAYQGGVAMDPRLKLGRQAHLSIPCCRLECASAVIVVERGPRNCSYYPFADVPAATDAYKHMRCARIMYTVEDGKLSTELQAGGSWLAHNTIRRASLKCSCE